MTYLDLLIFFSVAGIVLGFTPSLIGIFCSNLTGHFGREHDATKVIIGAGSFFVGFIATLTLIGVAFWQLLINIPAPLADYVLVLLCIAGISAGLLEIKDYFWYGKGLSHRPHKKIKAIVHARTTKKYSAFNALQLGGVAVAASVTNLGISTLLVSSLLFSSGTSAEIGWIFIYALSLSLPLVCILVAAGSAKNLAAIISWKETNKGVLRLSAGFTIILLSWVVLLSLSKAVVIGVAL